MRRGLVHKRFFVEFVVGVAVLAALDAVPGWAGANGPQQPVRVPPRLERLSGGEATTMINPDASTSLTGWGASAARGSAGGWSMVPSANPVGPSGQFFSVSCSAASLCTAVGSSVSDSGFSVTEAERWDGTRWRIERTPSLRGASSSSLLDVACPSASACMAVGRSLNRSGVFITLAERWNGRKWAILATPNPAHVQGSMLDSVACTSPSACIAVGSPLNKVATQTTGTLAERWNGSRWTILRTPTLHSNVALLASVACTTASDCLAVGGHGTSTAPVTLAERWNGRKWTILPTPTPRAAQGALLAGVSCTSTSSCAAVGNYFGNSNNQMALAEGWNGRRWTIQRTPNPGPGGQLKDVACTSASNCTAVGGDSQDQFGNPVTTLAAHWNGKHWRALPVPSGTRPSGLSAVACTTGSSCVAVGNSGPANLAERWNGRRWKVQRTPTPKGMVSSELNGLACTSASACIAVGDRPDLSGNPLATVAERWNGTRWVVQPTPNPAGLPGRALTNVACPSVSVCIAVGFLSDSSGTPRGVFSERWDGSRWRIAGIPRPPGARGSYLGGLACTSPSACIAVGSINNGGSPTGTLAARWNGTQWSLMPIPSPPGAAGAYLPSLACPSPSACIAAGSRTDSSGTPTGTLVERWDGSNWSILPTPTPAGAQGAELDGIACTSASSCIAVGAIDNPSGQQLLTEQWDGHQWTILPTPTPPGAQGGLLNSVSCTSPLACTATGLVFTPNLPLIYAVRWDGNRWNIQPTPPLLAYDIGAAAVTCTSASSCMTVGAFLNTFPNGPKQVLAERWTG